MTVSETTPPLIKYAYSGPADFTFSFKIFEETDIKVRYINSAGVVSAPWTLTSDYTITEVDGIVGGTVTVLADVDDGWIEIYRDLPLSQETVWENYGPFNADILEDDLDRCIMLIQEFESTLTNTTNAINWKGDWATLTAYVVGDFVAQSGNVYYCLTAHTSGTFATDLAAAYWALVIEGVLDAGPSVGSILTLASGVITIPNNNDGRYRLYSESGAADDLTSILGPVDRDYIIHLYSADYPITVIDGSYIHLDGGVDFILPESNGVITLISIGSGSGNQQWLEVSRSSGI